MRSRLCCLLLLLGAAPALAGPSVRAMGMSDAYAALAGGIEATIYNPANLALGERPGLSISLLSASADLANNGIGLALYNQSMQETLSDEEKQQILRAIPESGMDFAADLHAQALGLQLGQFALVTRGQAKGYGTLPRELFELILEGNAQVDSLALDSADAEAYALAEVDLAMATSLVDLGFGRLHAGASFRYLQAFAYGRLIEVDGDLVTRPSGVRASANAELLSATGGQGLGLDLGLLLEIPRGLRAAATLENAFGRLRMDQGLERRFFTVHSDTLSLATLEEDEDDLFHDDELVEAADPFSFSLPRILHLGLARRFARGDLAAQYTQGFSNRAGASTTPSLAVGGELRLLGFLPLRLGLSAGGLSGRSASAGFGLHAFGLRLDLAARSYGEWIPDDPKGIGVAVGTGLSF